MTESTVSAIPILCKIEIVCPSSSLFATRLAGPGGRRVGETAAYLATSGVPNEMTINAITTAEPHAASKSRDSMSDALSTVLPALTKETPGGPDANTLRRALRKYALLPEGKRPTAPPDMAEAIRWLESASLDIQDLSETKVIRPALDALALCLDGTKAGANTVKRKRAVLHNVLEYAVELEELPSNPLHRVKWSPPKTTETVAPRVVVNPRRARELLVAATYGGKRGRGARGRGQHLMALFACMYFAALRPAEAVSLRKESRLRAVLEGLALR